MTTSIASLRTQQPKMLRAFNTTDTGYGFIGLEQKSDAFCLKQVACKCGHDQFNVLTTVTKQRKKRLFKTIETLVHLAPIKIKCASCGSEHLVFDPSIHGWDGETKNSAVITGQDGQQIYNRTPKSVYVEFSYQRTENYQDLIKDGIDNPEDYFDSFSLYIVAPGRSKAERVVDYECQ